ncbi:other/RAN protein kinase [Coprinopsis cinerea okayama7|uniref:Other/RAN protein kinase n=1 Tax=Coprinopsis cinerea (strain Okayama-7 / 130 / ATCC MYA-4618 / FGSC 9003) TaxID=240176 RepID=A8NC21_COPC7|nr:other/RAN protein kinase [Coprinopsis cinerea okayama7\|eukprot:XP_001832365.2 other/RAN protein kinase [Coprinopsis cinerea okayama7\
MSKFATSSAHPPPGTLIDNDTLELVELVGSGGYGVVYRAVETTAKPGRKPRTFAVKVLSRTDGRRNTHIREASLHYHVSGHPHIIDLYQVLEDDNYMYFVMQYARSKDLFHQILNKSYYLGNDQTTKMVFLQILDAVDHLHQMGVYHRDLKPENILCLDEGYRIAISDFGLATTDKTSVEFRTGSVYHMSPECQCGRYAEDAYSPMSNDVWSLGIILLNMVTGRNPWKSATTEDPVFQSYCRSPFNFFCSVLPISSSLNKILIQVLDPNWKTRMTLKRLRQEIEKIDTFYSPKVVFEGSLARCPWEVDGSPAKAKDQANKPAKRPPVKRRPVPPTPAGAKPFVKKEHEAPPPSTPPDAVNREAHVRHRATPPPPPPATPVKQEAQPPRRRPAPPVDDFSDEMDHASLGDSRMESVSLDEASSSDNSASIDLPHTPYHSHPSSSSSATSFPKTPDTGGFMGSRRENKVDVKIMASTHTSPLSSFGGQTHAPTILNDFSYIDLSFSKESLKRSIDQAMLSPAPSQYSLHEASDFSKWSDSTDTLAQDRRRCANDSRSEVILYPDLQTPAPSKPIDIGRVAAMKRLWEKKLPSKPMQSYTGRRPCCSPPQGNRYWFTGKALA